MGHPFPKRLWIVVALLLPVLAVAHGVALYRIASHLAWTVAVGFFLLVLLTHSGVLGSIYAMCARRSKNKS